MTLKLGDSASVNKTITASDVETFADLALDHNPVHLDATYAKSTRFQRPIVHGMLSASLFSGLLGQQLPGPGTIYLGQSLRFMHPVYVGERVTATIHLSDLNIDKGIATFITLVINTEGIECIQGEAVVKLPEPVAQSLR
ncbi:MaoC family dehydratase [Ferrimonas aestuarii]|uniref:MaoC family dehydratase n=1 Tax=Ferrimonas aestuarii TaxID=2569539 RepID=A0A4U1BLI9_9GAMM|nr:MaoC family dehydratase [Ferrimonas aestuarii]TKB53686.1 MaoC family dehydratase [Ferrimonas aestuarii]